MPVNTPLDTMPIEARFLVLSLMLYAVMIIVQAVLSNREHSPSDLLGSRDDVVDTSPFIGRARRANANMVEALMLFAPAVLLVLVLGRSNYWTELGSMVFFLSRATFGPLYWFGIAGFRSIAWFVGVVGTIMIYSALWPLAGI